MSPTAAAPDDIVETHQEGAASARGPLLVLGPLRRFLHEAGLHSPEDLRAEPIGDGHSNVTYALSTGIILRRPPRGPLPPSAHDVLREARLLSALSPTDVRAPRVLAVGENPTVIGAPFYLMERVPGVVITDTLPDALDNETERDRIADQLIDALVELHSVDPISVGLESFGKPTGYLERQLRRLSGLWEHNRTRDLPAMDELRRWLAEHMPGSPTATIVHGDYRLGNTIYAPSAPAHLNAILDWEMAAIGDPLADVGYMMIHWHQAGDAPGGFNLQAITQQAGFPLRADMIDRYERRSGRSIRALEWYLVLALWKAVVFMEGNYKRALAGTTDDPYLRAFGDSVVELADHALEITRMSRPTIARLYQLGS